MNGMMIALNGDAGSKEIVYYADFVQNLIKKYPECENLAIAHLGLGVTGEAGELADCLKKVAIYEKPLDRANLVEELGDLNFFVQAIQNHFGITEAEIINANVAKLKKRYANGYSDKAAQERADKVAEEIYYVTAHEHEIKDKRYVDYFDTEELAALHAMSMKLKVIKVTYEEFKNWFPF